MLLNEIAGQVTNSTVQVDPRPVETASIPGTPNQTEEIGLKELTEKRYDIINEGTIADAILDRLVNSSHRIDLKGESLRKGILKNE